MKAPVEHCPVEFEHRLICLTGSDEANWERPAHVRLRDARQVDDRRGSDTTSVMVRYNRDSGYMNCSGNLGRWGHRDNVWGVDVWRAAMGFMDYLHKHHRPLSFCGDPLLTRVDLTANIRFESAQDAYDWIKWAGSQKLSRAMPRLYDTGVAWVTENWSAKVYDKLADLRRHGLTALALRLQSEFGYVLRLETTLRTDELERLDGTLLSTWHPHESEGKMARIFLDKFAPLIEAKGVGVDDAVRTLPLRLANALDAWRHGMNYPAAVADGRMNVRTYQRLRKELKAYGVDIALPCNVTNLRIKPREIQPAFIAAPDWYRRAA